MYLKDRYFQEINCWPTVDLDGGYFTILRPLEPAEADPLLRQAVAHLESASQFTFLYKGEERFNGWTNTGPSSNWIEVAWCDAAGVAAITYRGEGIPSRVQWFDGATPDEAIDQWCKEYVVPVPVVEGEDDDE